jgi:hypothetical protein
MTLKARIAGSTIQIDIFNHGSGRSSTPASNVKLVEATINGKNGKNILLLFFVSRRF